MPLRSAPKVAVVVIGDPDPLLIAAAREIEARLSIAAEVRLPVDAALRAALHGEAGAEDDGLSDVRGDRRRLGAGEASDAPVLQRLGRRAGAVTVIAVRETDRGPEAVALDVRSGQFFEGVLPLGEPDPRSISSFVARRARTSARAVASAGAADPSETAAEAELPSGATQPDEEDEGQSPGEWMEQNWPYFAAGALLAAAITFIAVTATDGGTPPPMLRFQPGTP